MAKYRTRKRYGRKTFRGRRRFGRKPFRAGFNRTGGFYKRGGASANRAELKFFDTAQTINPILEIDNGFPSSLVHIVQGTGESERIGRKILVKQIQIRLNFALGTTDDPTRPNQTFRFVMYIDKQANGQQTDPDTQLFTGDQPFAYRNLANSYRFKVMFDKIFTMNSMAATGNDVGTTGDFGTVRKYLTISKRCNIPILYSGVTGGMSEIKTNNITYAVYAITANVLGSLTAHVRIRFTG